MALKGLKMHSKLSGGAHFLLYVYETLMYATIDLYSTLDANLRPHASHLVSLSTQAQSNKEN